MHIFMYIKYKFLTKQKGRCKDSTMSPTEITTHEKTKSSF